MRLERLRRPGGCGTAVNPYPGPLLYDVEREWDPWLAMQGMPAPYRLGGMVGPRPVHRDANLGWGMWPQRARLPYVPVFYAGLWVPMYVGDPERAVWRRRKWWGRGPIIFAPAGRAHRRALALCDCFIAAAEGWPHAVDCATRRGWR